jgi:hypothetical protein
MKGIVEEIDLPPKGSGKEVAHLRVKNGTDSADVYLCPKTFLDDMGVNFSKGDEVGLTGSKVKDGETDLFLAREIVKGTDTIVLRDDKGNPVLDLAPLRLREIASSSLPFVYGPAALQKRFDVLAECALYRSFCLLESSRLD